MAVLGDDPTYIMDMLGTNLLEVFGGTDYPIILGIVLFGILAYLALSYRLDRGALTLLGILGVGIMISIPGAIPQYVWFVMILLVGVVGAYGVLNALRQGEA